MHDGRRNSYSLIKDGKKFTLLPQKKKAKSSIPNSSFLVTKLFMNESLEVGIVYMLLSPLELEL